MDRTTRRYAARAEPFRSAAPATWWRPRRTTMQSRTGYPLTAPSFRLYPGCWKRPLCEATEWPRAQLHRHIESERFGGLEVDNERELGGRLHRKLAWIFALEDSIDIGCAAPE